LCDELFASLVVNSDYEVVFAGNLTPFQVRPYLIKYPMLKYIHTADCICPAQCYEITRRAAIGDLIMWVADDCEFSPKLLDNVYDFHHSQPLEVQIISVKTNENNINTDLNLHTLLGSNVNTPLMAPLGVISRMYLENIGGFDRRYVCGQYENDVVMRVYANGGKLVKYEEGCVNIEHLKKHGIGTKFWEGYIHDRKILEGTWIPGGWQPVPELVIIMRGFKPPEQYFPVDNRKVSDKPLLPFEPYTDENLTTVSQCPIAWPIVRAKKEMTLELSR
jgi:hypothetical protein